MDFEELVGERDIVARPRYPLRSKSTRVLVVAAVLLSALAGFFVFDLDHYLTLHTLAENRAWLLGHVASNHAAAVCVFLAVYALAVAVSVPGAMVLTVAGGFLFGTVQGSIYAVTGATLGAVCLFLFVRAGLGDAIMARPDSSIDRLRRGFRENALGYLLFLRLLPVVPFWLVNLAAAVLGVPLRTFILATAVGIVPGSVVYSSFGSGLGFILDGGRKPDMNMVLTPQVLLPLTGLALLALAPTLYRTFKHRSRHPS